MRVELSAVIQGWRLHGNKALKPQQEREITAPLKRRLLGSSLDFNQGGVKRAATGRARRERLGAFAIEQERFTSERGGAFDV